MAVRKWDPYGILHITSRESDGMTCVWQSRYGNPCTRVITPDRFEKIHSILDEIEKVPPNDASPAALQELAQLSLCEDLHQNQVPDILAGWDVAINDAAAEYQESEDLKSRSEQLERQLKVNEEVIQRMSTRFDEVQAQVRKEKAASTQHKERWTQVEAANRSLSTRLEQLQSSLSRSDENSRRLQDLLIQQRSELSTQLTAARKASKEYKVEAEMDLASRSQIIDDLRSKLDDQHRVSSQRLEALEEVTAQRSLVIKEVDSLRSQLSEQRGNSVRISRELKEAMTQRTEFFEKMETLRSELAAAEQKSNRELRETMSERTKLLAEVANLKAELSDIGDELNKQVKEATADKVDFLAEIDTLKRHLSVANQRSNDLQEALGQVESKQALVSKAEENSQARLANEQDKAAELRREIGTREAELASVQIALKRTQLDLEKGHQANEEEKASVTARSEAYSKELAQKLVQTQLELEKCRKVIQEQKTVAASRDKTVAEMLAQINQLETQVSSNFWKSFVEKLQSLAKSVGTSILRSRRKEPNGAIEMAEQSVE